jgi:Flp pilus assembly pilin Flp
VSFGSFVRTEVASAEPIEEHKMIEYMKTWLPVEDQTIIEYMQTWLELKTDHRAVTALEYALIAGVIVATVMVGFKTLATNLSTKLAGITF